MLPKESPNATGKISTVQRNDSLHILEKGKLTAWIEELYEKISFGSSTAMDPLGSETQKKLSDGKLKTADYNLASSNSPSQYSMERGLRARCQLDTSTDILGTHDRQELGKALSAAANALTTSLRLRREAEHAADGLRAELERCTVQCIAAEDRVSGLDAACRRLTAEKDAALAEARMARENADRLRSIANRASKELELAKEAAATAALAAATAPSACADWMADSRDGPFWEDTTVMYHRNLAEQAHKKACAAEERERRRTRELLTMVSSVWQHRASAGPGAHGSDPSLSLRLPEGPRGSRTHTAEVDSRARAGLGARNMTASESSFRSCKGTGAGPPPAVPAEQGKIGRDGDGGLERLAVDWPCKVLSCRYLADFGL